MFYICKGTCLCLSGQGQGSVVYCYGDPAARNLNSLQEEEVEGSLTSLPNLSPHNILALTQISVITLGMVAILVTLVLIRNSVRRLDRRISDLALHLEFCEEESEQQRLSSTSHHMHGVKKPPLDTVDCGGPGCTLCKNGAANTICDL